MSTSMIPASFDFMALPTELQAMTLQHLRAKELLLAKRVSHEVHNIIKRTPELRRKLFLLPLKHPKSCKYTKTQLGNRSRAPIEQAWMTPATREQLNITADEVVHEQSIIAGSYHYPGREYKEGTYHWDGHYYEDNILLGQLNRLIFEIQDCYFSTRPSANSGWHEARSPNRTRICFIDWDSVRQWAPDSPYMDMFVTQPPAKALVYCWAFGDCATRRRPMHRFGGIKNDDGVTVGDVLKKIEEYETEYDLEISWERSWTHVRRMLFLTDTQLDELETAGKEGLILTQDS